MKKHFKITHDLYWNQIIWRANKNLGKEIWALGSDYIMRKSCIDGTWNNFCSLDTRRKQFIFYQLNINPVTGESIINE